MNCLWICWLDGLFFDKEEPWVKRWGMVIQSYRWMAGLLGSYTLRSPVLWPLNALVWLVLFVWATCCISFLSSPSSPLLSLLFELISGINMDCIQETKWRRDGQSLVLLYRHHIQLKNNNLKETKARSRLSELQSYTTIAQGSRPISYKTVLAACSATLSYVWRAGANVRFDHRRLVCM